MNTYMIKEVYDALIEAGASDEKARAAAVAIAAYENRFAKIAVEGSVEAPMGQAGSAALDLLIWMAGINLAMTAAATEKSRR